jgi:hypothetical protein
LAITVKEEVLGSFGPSSAVEDAAEAVYAMIESKHSVQGKQNIVDPSTLHLSTQVHGGTQNTDYPYTFQLSPQVHGGTQNTDYPYTFQLSPQVHDDFLCICAHRCSKFSHFHLKSIKFFILLYTDMVAIVCLIAERIRTSETNNITSTRIAVMTTPNMLLK